MKRDNIQVNDRQLACARINSEEGQNYLKVIINFILSIPISIALDVRVYQNFDDIWVQALVFEFKTNYKCSISLTDPKSFSLLLY